MGVYKLIGIAIGCVGGIVIAIRRARGTRLVHDGAVRRLAPLAAGKPLRAEVVPEVDRGKGALALYPGELVFVPDGGEPVRVAVTALTDLVEKPGDALQVEWPGGHATWRVFDASAWVADLASMR